MNTKTSKELSNEMKLNRVSEYYLESVGTATCDTIKSYAKVSTAKPANYQHMLERAAKNRQFISVICPVAKDILRNIEVRKHLINFTTTKVYTLADTFAKLNERIEKDLNILIVINTPEDLEYIWNSIVRRANTDANAIQNIARMRHVNFLFNDKIYDYASFTQLHEINSWVINRSDRAIEDYVRNITINEQNELTAWLMQLAKVAPEYTQFIRKYNRAGREFIAPVPAKRDELITRLRASVADKHYDTQTVGDTTYVDKMSVFVDKSGEFGTRGTVYEHQERRVKTVAAYNELLDVVKHFVMVQYYTMYGIEEDPSNPDMNEYLQDCYEGSNTPEQFRQFYSDGTAEAYADRSYLY